MPSLHHGLSWTSLLLAAGIGLANPAVETRDRPRSDLDQLSNADLNKYIRGELDDIFEGADPNENVKVCDLYHELMDALSDEGDDDDSDALDDEIDESELEAEMEEIDSSLDAEVQASIGARCGGGGAIEGAHGPRIADAGSAFESGALMIPRRQAVNLTASRLIRQIRAKS